MSAILERLEARARTLDEAAAGQGEISLLRAAVWLEGRYAASTRKPLCEAIALHYLLLARLREVHAQPGLADRYRRRAEAWAAHAELGVCSAAFATSFAESRRRLT